MIFGGPEKKGSGTAKKSSASKAKPAGDKKNAKKKAASESNGSTGLIIGGAVTTGIFGLGFLSIAMEALSYGFYGDELVSLAACGLFFLGGLAMLIAGIGGRGRGERYVNYLAYIGANREVDLARMAAAFDVSVRKLCKDLRHMLAKASCPQAIWTWRRASSISPRWATARQSRRKSRSQEKAGTGRPAGGCHPPEIRQVNDEIPDEEMSAKIYRIEEITGKILDYQKKHPNRQGQLRTFLNYYLPTTLKILRAYAQLEAQGIEGENISAAKARIEGMMDQVVAGFEKQLE